MYISEIKIGKECKTLEGKLCCGDECIPHLAAQRTTALQYGRWFWWWGGGIRETNSLFIVTVLLNIFLGFSDKILRAEKGKSHIKQYKFLPSSEQLSVQDSFHGCPSVQATC